MTFQDGVWYAIHVRSRHEKQVAATLKGKGIEAYLPLYRSRQQWSDRIKEVELPLFAGYVFSQFDPQNQLPILQSPGVVRIVSFGKELAPVDPRELDQVERILQSGLLVAPWPFLKVGDHVTLKHGPLKGLEGVILNVKGNYRLVVSVSLLQRSVAVEIDSAWVSPAKPSSARPRQTPLRS
jgi:transcription antitermination factor NusG